MSDMILQTERLYLREMTQSDFPLLCKHLQDAEVMYAYEHPFSDNEVQEWLERQLDHYKAYGFGLWAVILKDNDELIGQCGLTMQCCEESEVLEVGYLFDKRYWHKGYAIEAATACKKYAFEKLNADEVFSIIRDTNLASQNVARRNGMRIRAMQESDYECLNEFLYQAIFIHEGDELPPRSIIYEPEIFAYIKDFGTQPGDLGVVAEQNGQIIGAAWTRIIPAYGHIDENTPELAVSLLPEFRRYGIGTKLIKKMFEVLQKNGYQQTSLSVQTDNPAVRLYQRLGYTVVCERPDHAGHIDYLMRKDLS